MVHRIHEWMEEKLQTYFKRDTECLNHNIWMISCMSIWCCCCWFLVFLVVCFFLFDGFYRTWYLSCFCSGCICTLRFTTFTYWTSLTKGNERRKKASSSRIGWTVSRPPMTTEVFITSLCFRYEIMKKCWRDEPNLRPSFEELRNKLSEMENQHKVELKSFQRDSLSLPIFFFWKFERLNLSLSNWLDNSVTKKASKRSSWFQFISLLE